MSFSWHIYLSVMWGLWLQWNEGLAFRAVCELKLSKGVSLDAVVAGFATSTA